MKPFSSINSFLVIFTLSLAANAGTLKVTCGKNAYEALEQKKLAVAEFALQLKTKGPNNPPVVEIAQDDGTSFASKIINVAYQFPNITITLRGNDKYKIANLTGCSSIETATGDIEFWQYVGGFAGTQMKAKAKCSCLAK